MPRTLDNLIDVFCEDEPGIRANLASVGFDPEEADQIVARVVSRTIERCGEAALADSDGILHGLANAAPRELRLLFLGGVDYGVRLARNQKEAT